MAFAILTRPARIGYDVTLLAFLSTVLWNSTHILKERKFKIIPGYKIVIPDRLIYLKIYLKYQLIKVTSIEIILFPRYK
jgi:hypothetical protein